MDTRKAAAKPQQVHATDVLSLDYETVAGSDILAGLQHLALQPLAEHHFVYWRRLSNDDIGIVTILHLRMHQLDRFRDSGQS